MRNIFPFLKAFLTVSAFTYLFGVSTANVFQLLGFALFIFLYRRKKDDNSTSAILCSIVFGIFAVLNLFETTVYPDLMGNINAVFKLFKIVSVFTGIFFFMKMVLTYIYGMFEKLSVKKRHPYSNWLVFGVSFAVLFLFYLPAWLMEYPSNIGADTLSQIKQILSGSYVNHHPFAHTQWLRLLMSFGKGINEKIGIAALLQLIINALVFAFAVKTVYRKSENIIIAGLTLAFYALLSFNSFLSVTLVKDVTHATVGVLLAIELFSYFDEENRKILHLIFIYVLCLGFCLFRTNGFYACVFMLVVAVIVLFKRKDYKLLGVLAASVVSAWLIKGPLYTALGVRSGSFAEMLSIPLQQIALVIKDGYSLNANETALLGRIIDIAKVPEVYDEFLSDPIKNMVNESGNVVYLKENIMEYLKVWIQIGLRYPAVYIRAWVNQVSTFFSPRYYGTSFYWGLMKNNIEITAEPLIRNKELREQLHMMAYNQHNLPFIGMFHYPSVSTWIMLVMGFYAVKKKKIASIIIISLFTGIFLTLLISCPYNICFRYYYSVVVCVPLFIVFTLCERSSSL